MMMENDSLDPWSNLPNKLVKNGWQGVRMILKREKVMDSHDHTHPEWMQHIKGDVYLYS